MRSLIVLFALIAISSCQNWRPVVLMHGILGDAATMYPPMGWIQDDFPGIYVTSIEIGNGAQDSVLMDINQQVEVFAQQVQADPNLQEGFNLVCHSQGGLICRAFIERYNSPPAYNYISWAGPQQGVYGTPDWNALCPPAFCPYPNVFLDALLDLPLISQAIQTTVSFAAYWKDPNQYGSYLSNNIFLADINNENSINQNYVANMESLNSILLIYSTNDTVIVPQVSPWFFFFEENDDSVIVPFNESETYEQNLIGLQTLFNEDKIEFQSVPCTHQNIPADSCRSYYELYTRAYLNNTLSGGSTGSTGSSTGSATGATGSTGSTGSTSGSTASTGSTSTGSTSGSGSTGSNDSTGSTSGSTSGSGSGTSGSTGTTGEETTGTTGEETTGSTSGGATGPTGDYTGGGTSGSTSGSSTGSTSNGQRIEIEIN